MSSRHCQQHDPLIAAGHVTCHQCGATPEEAAALVDHIRNQGEATRSLSGYVRHLVANGLLPLVGAMRKSVTAAVFDHAVTLLPLVGAMRN